MSPSKFNSSTNILCISKQMLSILCQIFVVKLTRQTDHETLMTPTISNIINMWTNFLSFLKSCITKQLTETVNEGNLKKNPKK